MTPAPFSTAAGVAVADLVAAGRRIQGPCAVGPDGRLTDQCGCDVWQQAEWPPHPACPHDARGVTGALGVTGAPDA